ncbi:endolytic transglycosylase MltG [Alphaproteobacteria bacterium]|nr:endolytic transglycosylase MltG [Alphaproteobacteria bacterium]
MKLKINFFLSIITTSILFLYFYFDNLKNKEFLNENTYIFVKKKDTQKIILKKLGFKKNYISYFDWRIISLWHKKKLSPKAGEYLIPKGSSIFEIQNIFQVGRTITRSFTLIEGSSASDLKQNLLSNKYLSGEIPILIEGIYKPDTYHFKFGYSRNKLLRRMKKAQDISLNTVWKNKPKNFTLKNKYELLILASIIQKEAKSFEDSKLVASVFINRLRKKMKLQSDVTLAYGLNINGKYITKKMLKSPHPFNTYFYSGLPPEPISYPGNNALNALKNFKDTNYLYFVADGNGGHRFSETYSLHKQNIKMWKKSILRN